MGGQLILYSGTLCHLCEDAKALVYPLLPADSGLIEVNIDTDPLLKKRYGSRIPVLAIVREDGEVVVEKGWPFSQGQVKRIIAEL